MTFIIAGMAITIVDFITYLHYFKEGVPLLSGPSKQLGFPTSTLTEMTELACLSHTCIVCNRAI